MPSEPISSAVLWLVNGVLTTHIEIEELIEALTADVHSELGGVLAEDFGVIVRPLKGVTSLRKLAFEVVTQCESTGYVNVRNANASGKVGGDASAEIHRVA